MFVEVAWPGELTNNPWLSPTAYTGRGRPGQAWARITLSDWDLVKSSTSKAPRVPRPACRLGVMNRTFIRVKTWSSSRTQLAEVRQRVTRARYRKLLEFGWLTGPSGSGEPPPYSLNHSATPPWCEQVPRRVRLKLNVPSLQWAVAPSGGLPSAVRVGDGTHSPWELMYLRPCGVATCGAWALRNSSSKYPASCETATLHQPWEHV